MNWTKIEDSIVTFIAKECHNRRAIIGLSGGLDSSVVATLTVKALGPDRVIGLLMPDMEHAKNNDLEDARQLSQSLNIKTHAVDISRVKHAFIRAMPDGTWNDKLLIGNAVARLRMTYLYAFAKYYYALVIGTSDKSEILLGFYTKYGDGAADILPIASLYKTEVREFASYLKLPERIVTKPSSPNLWANQTAEGEIGFSYVEVDAMLKGDKPMHPEIQNRIERNSHKRMPIRKLEPGAWN